MCLHCFANVIIDDLLVIYYEETDDPVQRELVETLRHSPYRNYVQREVPETEQVVHMLKKRYEPVKHLGKRSREDS